MEVSERMVSGPKLHAFNKITSKCRKIHTQDDPRCARQTRGPPAPPLKPELLDLEPWNVAQNILDDIRSFLLLLQLQLLGRNSLIFAWWRRSNAMLLLRALPQP